MKLKIRQNLENKGWTKAELARVDSGIASHKVHDKSNSKKSLAKVVYWTALLVIAVCNLGLAVFLIPFFIVLGDTFSTLMVLIIGGIMGTLFAFTIQDIEYLERKHHLFAMIFIPLTAIINIFIMVKASNFAAEVLIVEAYNNPLLMSLLYVLAFLIPYFYYNILQR